MGPLSLAVQRFSFAPVGQALSSERDAGVRPLSDQNHLGSKDHQNPCIADSLYWAKTLAQVCRKCGYHMISQLKSNSVLWIHGKKTNVTSLLDLVSSYREVSLFVYGKTKTLQ